MPVKELAIGKVKTSHGVKGYIKVEPLTDETEHFTKIDWLHLQQGERSLTKKVEDVRIAGNHVLIKFEDISSPEEAKRYNNWILWVERSRAAPLQEGEYYSADICQCDLVKDGVKYGNITAVCSGGRGDFLEVRRENGTTALVPFMDRFIGEIDIHNNTIELRTEWILE